MVIPSEKFARDLLVSLAEQDRNGRLRELEGLINQTLALQQTLTDFQETLYLIIEELESIGHFLGRWEYDCEIEYWGGKSYLDPNAKDELLLRSEFPEGIRLSWANFEALQKSAV